MKQNGYMIRVIIVECLKVIVEISVHESIVE